MSVYEVADITVKAGSEAQFEAGVREAAAIFVSSPGCHEIKLERCIETPQRYLLRVVWDSVQAHMDFRASDNFGKWRGLVGDCFASPPQVVHTEVVLG
jgi:heme-degrading monooxygenase HmoA